jgi:hypothetical protein
MSVILKRAASNRRKPENLHTDAGTEFFNVHFKKLMTSENINLFTTYSDTKAALAEIFIQTLKSKIIRMLDQNLFLKNRYIDKFQDILHSYNNQPQALLCMAPAQINQRNEGEILYRSYGYLWEKNRGSSKKTLKFKVGDYVRISILKHPFGKGYHGKWHEKLYIIDSVKITLPFNMYTVKDLRNSPLKGSFYEQQLQKAEAPSTETEYQIEKVIKSRRRRGRREYFIKWAGYDNEYNSWEPEENIKEYIDQQQQQS